MQYRGCWRGGAEGVVVVAGGGATIGATFQQAEIYVGYKLRGLSRLLDRLYQACSGPDTQITNMSAADKLSSRAHVSGTESRRVVVVVVVVVAHSLLPPLVGRRAEKQSPSCCRCRAAGTQKRPNGLRPLPTPVPTPPHTPFLPPPPLWVGTATPRSHHCPPHPPTAPRWSCQSPFAPRTHC